MIAGTLSATGLSFPGLNGYFCSAELDGKESRMLGEYTRDNPDGTVSQCADLTEKLGARLLIDWG